MRASLSEKKIVIILFVMVFITFSLAHEDSKKLEQLYGGGVSSATTSLASLKSATINKTVLKLRNLDLNQDRK
jgi:hypothetical protein